MHMHTITETKANLSAFLARLEREGGEFIIKRGDKPVAKVSPIQEKDLNPQKPKRIGFFKGKVEVADDFEEWPEDIQRALHMID